MDTQQYGKERRHDPQVEFGYQVDCMVEEVKHDSGGILQVQMASHDASYQWIRHATNPEARKRRRDMAFETVAASKLRTEHECSVFLVYVS